MIALLSSCVLFVVGQMYVAIGVVHNETKLWTRGLGALVGGALLLTYALRLV